MDRGNRGHAIKGSAWPIGARQEEESVPTGALSLSEVRERVDALIEGLLAELPEEPYFKDDSERTGWIYELKPNERDDYPGISDMFVGKATIPEFFGAVRNNYFNSECFSSCGEIFCYVKLDGKDGLDEEKFADKRGNRRCSGRTTAK